MRLLIVGQNPARPLAAPFDSASGDRLARLLGLEDRRRLADVASLDNCVATVATPSRSAYRDGAVRIRADYPGPRVVLACGPVVSQALGGPSRPLHAAQAGSWLVACLPHPSGRNRWWNDPDRTAAAARFARAVLTCAESENLAWTHKRLATMP